VGEGSQVQGALKFQNQDYVDQLLDQVTSSLDQPVVQHQAQVGDSSILFTRGQAGMAVDTQATEATLLERLSQGDLSDLPLEASVTEPDDPDFDALYQQVHTQPMDAALDPTTYEITPSTNGLSFDVATAQALFERTQPGESCSIPLTVTEPEITTEKLQASLFADLLGEAKSTVSGSAARKANVKLAGQMCSGTILLPGEVFSYWDKISPCSASQGFQAAPSYQNGQTVDSIGGGVCQVSSSIYYAALLSNLEIVQRQNHSYAVGYLPNGADATVFSGNPDFKFKNNTNYPIKIVATMSGNSLSVQIWGTKTDDTYVKMEFNDLSSTPYQTIYQIDDSVPAGTTKVSVTGYTGYKTEAYRCIYDGSGKLVSRTLESVSTYKKRDKIVLVNSADAAKYGLEGGTTPAEPSPSTTPDQTTPAPSPSTTPSPEPSTSPTTQPEPTPTPATSGETTSTQTTPAETQTETPSPTPSINIPPAP
jgi:vancomycin resistance protein YoaR